MSGFADLAGGRGGRPADHRRQARPDGGAGGVMGSGRAARRLIGAAAGPGAAGGRWHWPACRADVGRICAARAGRRASPSRWPMTARSGARADVPRKHAERRRGCCSSMTRPQHAAVLDEEHADPAGHDLCRRRRAGDAGAFQRRAAGSRRRSTAARACVSVLEINGGLAARLGIAPGAELRHPGWIGRRPPGPAATELLHRPVARHRFVTAGQSKRCYRWRRLLCGWVLRRLSHETGPSCGSADLRCPSQCLCRDSGGWGEPLRRLGRALAT